MQRGGGNNTERRKARELGKIGEGGVLAPS